MALPRDVQDKYYQQLGQLTGMIISELGGDPEDPKIKPILNTISCLLDRALSEDSVVN